MKTHVVKVSADATISEAVDLMDLYQTNALPVVDSENRLCGMLSESEVMRVVFDRQEHTAANSGEILECLNCSVHEIAVRFVREYMQVDVVFVSEGCAISEAATIMVQNGIKTIPVLTDEFRVVGMLNRVDIFQAVAEGRCA